MLSGVDRIVLRYMFRLSSTDTLVVLHNSFLEDLTRCTAYAYRRLIASVNSEAYPGRRNTPQRTKTNLKSGFDEFQNEGGTHGRNICL